MSIRWCEFETEAPLKQGCTQRKNPCAKEVDRESCRRRLRLYALERVSVRDGATLYGKSDFLSLDKGRRRIGPFCVTTTVHGCI